MVILCFLHSKRMGLLGKGERLKEAPISGGQGGGATHLFFTTKV